MPCSIFGTATAPKSPWILDDLKTVGFKDFKHPQRGVKLHEDSLFHINSTTSWKLYLRNLTNPLSLTGQLNQITENNLTHGRQVLEVILDAILFLAENNLAFQGHSRKIEDKDCGNFLGLIKLLSKYSAPLATHLARLKKGSTSYLSPQIQNEFVVLCAQSTKNKILEDIKSRKYFSIMVDSTPDSSRKDQLSEIIRTVECSQDGCIIHESFIDFISSNDKTGEALTTVILKKLENDGLELENCKGQGYDNGSNMSGAYRGVQARILQKNAEAIFVPCAAHSLNLVGSNVAEKNQPAKLILGQIQNLFAFFSSSTSRWEILTRLAKVCLKGHSKTRWSSKSHAVSALYDNFDGVLLALEEIADSSEFQSDVCAAAVSRLRDVKCFKFLLGLKIWNTILFQINLTNLSLQKENTDILNASKNLQKLLNWLELYKQTGFEQAVKEAEEIASKLKIDVNSGFDNIRRGRGINPRYDDADTVSRIRSQSNFEWFKDECFDSLLGQLIDEMKGRFHRLHDVVNNFSFLFGNGLLLTFEDKIKFVKDLETIYPNDFCITAFINEMQSFPTLIESFSDKPISECTPLDILNLLYCNQLENVYENATVALRIFLTIPVSVATNERAFSKLKIIKNYLRSTMGQERLSGLGILSIEREIAQSIDYCQIINSFLAQKNRRIEQI